MGRGKVGAGLSKGNGNMIHDVLQQQGTGSTTVLEGTAQAVNRARYRPEIDGLRAVAVVGVVLYHAGLFCPGGYVGVDVFFVISGYLITSLILHDVAENQFTLARFWERRVRRILPALAVVMAAVIVAGWFILLPADLKSLGGSASAQAAILANFYFSRRAGYFAASAETMPLLHTWSLAVEEQFYLLFPLFLVTMKRRSPKLLNASLLLLAALSLAVSVHGAFAGSASAFYLLPSRAWELLLGVLLALMPRSQGGPRWWRECLSWGGVAAVLGAVVFYGRNTPFPGVAALLPCLGAAAIMWSNQANLTSAGKVLALAPVVGLGKMSYSLYLWHWPLLVFTGYKYSLEQAPWWTVPAALIGSTVLALVSWKFVETPFRRRVFVRNPRWIFAGAGLAFIVFGVAGGVLYMLDGVPSRLPPQAQAYASAVQDRVAAEGSDATTKMAEAGRLPMIGVRSDAKAKLLLWGDSHARVVSPIVEALCREFHVPAWRASRSATPPLLDFGTADQKKYSEAVLRFIEQEHVSHVLLASRWSTFLAAPGGQAGLNATVVSLRKKGVTVWVLRDVPQQSCDVPRALTQCILAGTDPKTLGTPLAKHKETQAFANAAIDATLADGDIIAFDPTVYFVDAAGVCRAERDGHALYYDDSHLTVYGAMQLRPLFEAPIRELGRQ